MLFDSPSNDVGARITGSLELVPRERHGRVPLTLLPRLLAASPRIGDSEACSGFCLRDTLPNTGVFFTPLGGQYSCQGKFKHLYVASWHTQYFLTVHCQFLFFFWKILYYKLTLVLTHAIKK